MSLPMRTIAVAILLSVSAAAQPGSLTPANQLARDIFKELIEINTTDSSGNTTIAAEAMAARLKAAGFPADDVTVLGPHPRKGNLVVRYRGRSGSRKPLLLLAHLDVVEARREDWSIDPFTFTERDGYFYGRGTSDDKAQAALWIANLIRYKQEGFAPARDIIVALTADEEGGDFNGVTWLLANHKALVDAEYALNEGGNGQIKNGRKILNELQASEKVYLSFQLEVRNAGGHSSLPQKDNAIYHLSQGLARLAAFDFPVKLNEVTRVFFSRTAALETGPVAADMKDVSRTPPDAAAAARLSAQSAYYNALLRTTCVATRLAAGHADNALPQTARATVNCRLLPGESPADVQQTLVRVLADPAIAVTPIGTPTPSPPAPLTPEILQAVERATSAVWPGIPVVPVMGTGATDGLYLRNAGIPTFGVSGLFEDVDDVRAHGRDERVGVTEFFQSQEFLYRLVRELTR
jgi:acetylornithine deacetylase/succinyl-diaminopimelate desuccinylase-like protein